MFSKLCRILTIAIVLADVSHSRAAVLEMADGQTLKGTATFGKDSRISIKTDSGERSFSWDAVRVARLSKAAAEFKSLPHGWRVEDIGRVTGSSGDNNGTFVFTVNSADLKEKKFQALHYAYRLVRGEPEVVARITSAHTTAPAVGGVLLRENMELPGGYSLLGITGGNKLRFEYRENSWSGMKHQDLGTVQLPIWVKIARLEKESGVQAFKSVDGVKWTQVAQAKLSSQSGPFPESGDHWMPRVYAGLAITAPTNSTDARFECDRVAISCRGFLGEYFSETDFTKLAFARPDKKLDFWWGDRSPAPMLEPEKFSVRWRGSLEPKFSESYRFYSDTGTRLLLDGKDVTCNRWDEPRRERAEIVPQEITLVAGRKYDLQFEFAKNGREVRSARLAWSSRSQQREHITSAVVSYTFTTNTPGEDIDSVTNHFTPVGVWLRNGSFLAGEVTSSDVSATKTIFAGGPLSVLNHRVARLILRPMRRPVRFELAVGRTGMFLQNGDFLESEMEELNDRSVVMNSVLFGRRTYSRDNTQPLAVVLNDLSSNMAALSVRLADGSLLNARTVCSDGATLVVNETALGDLRVPATQVQEIRNAAGARRAAK